MIDQVAEVLGWMQQKDGSRLRDAENFIQENSNKEGFLPCLLEITGDSRYNGSDSEVNIAMGAVTILRNHIDERWDLDDISEKDRTILRDNIVPTMGQCTDLTIMYSLEDCVQTIAFEDYPQNWSGALEQIGERMVDEDPLIQYSSLCALKAIVKKYQSKLGAERNNLLEITRNSFDVLESLFESHLGIFNDTSVLILTVLTKIFFYANYVIEIDLHQIETGKIQKWISFFTDIMNREFEDLEVNEDDASKIEEKEKDYRTILLGSVCQASYRLLQKFGNKRIYRKKPEFADYYIKELAEPCMMAHLNIISKKDKFVGRKARYFSLRFIELSIQNKGVNSLIEPHMEHLLKDYIMPLVGMSVHDAIEFRDNPGESIRKELSSDPAQSDNCPKVAAKGLLVELVKYIPNKTYTSPPLLETCLEIIMDHLNEYKKDPDMDFRVKDACLYALYSIAPVIDDYQAFLDHIEDILNEHVLCELNGDNDFLKARALLFYNEITSRLDLENPESTEEYLSLLCSNLDKSQCLNVRVYALSCIKQMCNQDKGEEYLRDKVGNLLEINLEVLDEFFIEDLIETLNEIVHVFNKEAIPFALDVCTRLTEAYQDIMTQLGTSDTELENSKMANTANGCINAIYRLITSIGTQGKPEDREVIMKIEENSHDILFHSLDLKYSDVHESVMTCIGAITFYCENVTPNLWQLFEKLVELVSHHLNPETTDYGYISPGILGILNLMQKDPDTFINIKMSTDITPYDAVVSIITSIIDLSHDGEEDPILNKTGTELVIGLLENLHGKIDDSIHHIIELLVQEIGDNTDTSAKKMVIQGLLMCFAYNSPLTFRFLEEKDWTQGVFQVIFELLPEIKYDFEIKRMTLGLLSVISCKETEIPQLVLEAMPNIFQQILLLCQKSIYSREQKARSPEEKEKEQYEKSYNILDDWSDEDEYDEDDDYNPDDSKTESEDLYKSFTESVDEIQEVKSVMHSLGSNIYDLYFGKVPRDDIASLENCFSSPLVTN